MSHAVTARQRELGIRVALGARAGQVLRMVLARAGSLVVIGGVTGLMVSWWATTLVASLLHGTPPRDAMAFGAAAVVILVDRSGGRLDSGADQPPAPTRQWSCAIPGQ